jgi:hypothetical protein
MKLFKLIFKFDYILLMFLVFSFYGCTHRNVKTSSCNFESVIPDEIEDTVIIGQNFQANIEISNFDSILNYECILGQFDTIKIDNRCLLKMNEARKYLMLTKHRSFNTTKSFYYVKKADILGTNYYQGIIKYVDYQNIERFITFKGNYFVQDSIVNKE